MRGRPLLFAAPALTLLLSSSVARASGFSVARFGGEHGHPTTENATAIYYNPAGITGAEGTHLFLDGSLAWRSMTYTRKLSDTPEPAGAEGANVGEAKLFNILAGPMFGVTTKLGDAALGAGFYVPLGGRSEFQQNDKFANNSQFPGAVDSVGRWWSISGELIVGYLTAAGAYEFGDSGFSLGASLSLILSQVNTIRARTTAGDDNIAQEGRSWIKASAIQWGFGLGAMYEVEKKKFWLGASYTSKPNPFTSDPTLEGELNNYLGSSKAEPETVDLHQDLPDVFRLGGRYRPAENIEIRLFGDYTRWSFFERQCVTRRARTAPDDVQPCDTNADGSAPAGNLIFANQAREWTDGYAVRLGGSYWTSPELELFLGAGYTSNVVPDKTLDPSLPDFDNISLTAGGRFGLTENIFLAASYTQIFWFSREVQNLEIQQLAAPSNMPRANGTYSQDLGTLNANLDIKF